jgi:hypothetical protein
MHMHILVMYTLVQIIIKNFYYIIKINNLFIFNLIILFFIQNQINNSEMIKLVLEK